MKMIKLNVRWSTATKGLFALVDDDDYARVSAYHWSLAKRGQHIYAKTHINRKLIYLHRFIVNPTTKQLIDHINCNGLDNRKTNLRLCSHAQNRCNRAKTKQNTSGYKGVYFDKRRNRWTSRISCGEIKAKHLGSFGTKEEAALAYNIAASKYHGEFAKLNDIKV